MERQKPGHAAQAAAGPAGPAAAGSPECGRAGAPAAPRRVRPARPTSRRPRNRRAARRRWPRARAIPIETPAIKGSIDLKGGRIDDISLTRYHETVDPNSPAIVLLSPSGSPHPFYAEFGWVGAAGANVKTPGPDTVWQREGAGSLDAGKADHARLRQWRGPEVPPHHRRSTTSISSRCRDEVINSTAAPVTLYPYALISRHGTPQTSGYYILHEGMIGVMGDQGLQEITYKTIDDKKNLVFKAINAWMGITDKYWAATLLPNTDAQVQAHFSATDTAGVKTYQTDYLLDAQDDRAGRDGNRGRAPVRRRQGSRGRRHQFPPRRHRRLQPGSSASTTSIC